MKKYLKILFMISSGLMFLPAGIWLNNQQLAHPYTMPPYVMVNLVCIVLWLNFSFLMKNEKTATRTVVLSMNLVPAVVFMLNVYHHYVLRFYEGALGIYIQHYFLPLVFIKLPSFMPLQGLLSMYFSAFLTLVLCSFTGCKAKEAVTALKEAWS